MAYTAKFDENRTFGIEIEVYGIEQHVLSSEFYVHGITDYSIRDDGSISEPEPAEIVSPILCGRDGLWSVAKITGILRMVDCLTAKDCGLHVHHDVSDFTGSQLLSLLRFYTKYERVIDYLVASHRRENHCQFARTMWHKKRKPKGRRKSVAWVDNLIEKSDPLAAEVAIEFSEGYGLKRVSSYPSARHHKLNLCPVLEKGTVEFRQHHSTVNETEVCEWIVITQLMMTRAKRIKTDNEMKDVSIDSFIKVLGLNRQNNPFGIMDAIQERYQRNKENEQRSREDSVLSNSSNRRKSSSRNTVVWRHHTKNI